MLPVLALIVALEALMIGWLVRAVQRDASAHLAAREIFVAWDGIAGAQSRTNAATVDSIKALNRAITVHRKSLVLLHAQDQQVLDILVACGLIESPTPGQTVVN